MAVTGTVTVCSIPNTDGGGARSIWQWNKPWSKKIYNDITNPTHKVKGYEIKMDDPKPSKTGATVDAGVCCTSEKKKKKKQPDNWMRRLHPNNTGTGMY